jgi:membrane-bound lytic murein transglycosylase B
MLKIYIAILTLTISLQTVASQTFEDWKSDFIKIAAAQGVPSDFSKKILQDVQFDQKVIDKDRNQITSRTDINYQEWIVTWMRKDPSRIEMAREMLKKHKKLLEQIEKKYQVDKEVIVALWGVETLFGKINGDHDLLDSLATLTYDGRRRKFFQTQLVEALRLIYQGHVERKNLKGSWAGATGQCQFMPSNISVYAQDFDGDGKKDIWTNEADIFASIANLLKKGGWQKGLSIGTLALNPKNSTFDLQVERTPKQFNQLGLTDLKGKPLVGNWRRKVATIPMMNSPLVLMGSNYKPLLRWNNSSLFAAFNILIIEGLKTN